MKTTALIVLCVAILAVPMNLFAGEAEENPHGCSVFIERNVSDILEHGGVYMPETGLYGAKVCVDLENDSDDIFFVYVYDTVSPEGVPVESGYAMSAVLLQPGDTTTFFCVFPKYFIPVTPNAVQQWPGLYPDERFYR